MARAIQEFLVHQRSKLNGQGRRTSDVALDRLTLPIITAILHDLDKYRDGIVLTPPEVAVICQWFQGLVTAVTRPLAIYAWRSSGLLLDHKTA